MRIRQKTGRFHQPVLGVVGTLRDKLDIIISVESACVPTPLIHCSELVTPGQGPQYVFRQDGSALCFTKKMIRFCKIKKTSRNLTLLFYCMYLFTSHAPLLLSYLLLMLNSLSFLLVHPVFIFSKVISYVGFFLYPPFSYMNIPCYNPFLCFAFLFNSVSYKLL